MKRNNSHQSISVSVSKDPKEYHKQYRILNKDKIKDYEQTTQRKESNAKRIRRKKWHLIQLKECKCIKCGLIATEENSCIFDFHHIKNKTMNLAPFTAPLERLVNEIDNCILVCSNCHRLIHKKEY